MPPRLVVDADDAPEPLTQTPEQESVTAAIRAFPTLTGWHVVWGSDPVTGDMLRDALQVYLRGSQITAAERSVCHPLSQAAPQLRAARRDLEGLRRALLDVLPRGRIVSDDGQFELVWTELQGGVGEWRCFPLTGDAA